MKKTALILTILATCACNPTQPAEEIQTPVSIVVQKIRIYDVWHNDHKYIVFRSKQGYGESLDAIHAPDCPCMEEADK